MRRADLTAEPIVRDKHAPALQLAMHLFVGRERGIGSVYARINCYTCEQYPLHARILSTADACASVVNVMLSISDDGHRKQ